MRRKSRVNFYVLPPMSTSPSAHGTIPQIADNDGVLVSYYIESQKQNIKTKITYDYKNADVNGLIDHIKHFDFNTAVFQYPTVTQAELYTKVLTDAFSLFIPCKTVGVIHIQDCFYARKIKITKFTKKTYYIQ